MRFKTWWRLDIEIFSALLSLYHDDVIKWKHFPRNWPFVREIHRSPVNFPHKGQWRGALMFSLIYPWINDWVNNREAGDLRRQHGHYDVIVMSRDAAGHRWIPLTNVSDAVFNVFLDVWTNNGVAGDLTCHDAHVTSMRERHLRQCPDV